jgi:hypothetical protein
MTPSHVPAPVPPAAVLGRPMGGTAGDFRGEGTAEVGAVRLPVLPEPDYRGCQPADLPY